MGENPTFEPGIYFPDANEITPLAVAFAQMMFAHAAFEREVRELQAAITCVPRFGEERDNQWGARARPDLMSDLIAKHRGAIPEAKPIKSILREAIPACDDRNRARHAQNLLSAALFLQT
jgi:hypothetical protein